MSEESVEVVRRVYEALASRDVATILALYDPEVEFRFSGGTIADHIGGPSVYRGHAGLRAFDSELREAFTNFETNYEELIDAGERVVSVSRYRGQGRGSGVEVTGPVQFGVWKIREGRITRVDWFHIRAEALAAAGLSE
jgi:ketosteroid isomerase-like protein